jgi:hypothetical protein
LLTLADGRDGHLSDLGDGTTLGEDLTGDLSAHYAYLRDAAITVDLVAGTVND